LATGTTSRLVELGQQIAKVRKQIADLEARYLPMPEFDAGLDATLQTLKNTLASLEAQLQRALLGL
jgi:hypothetical protein